jgi:hypothetical protein
VVAPPANAAPDTQPARPAGVGLHRVGQQADVVVGEAAAVHGGAGQGRHVAGRDREPDQVGPEHRALDHAPDRTH